MVCSATAITEFFWMSELHPVLTVWFACLRVSVVQGVAEQTPETQLVSGVRMDPEAPMTETRPTMLEHAPKSLVNKPPAAAWQPDERSDARPKALEVLAVLEELVVVLAAVCPSAAGA